MLTYKRGNTSASHFGTPWAPPGHPLGTPWAPPGHTLGTPLAPPRHLLTISSPRVLGGAALEVGAPRLEALHLLAADALRSLLALPLHVREAVVLGVLLRLTAHAARVAVALRLIKRLLHPLLLRGPGAVGAVGSLFALHLPPHLVLHPPRCLLLNNKIGARIGGGRGGSGAGAEGICRSSLDARNKPQNPTKREGYQRHL
eukprot:1190502-Prorocentrum_minimum.AAC.2